MLCSLFSDNPVSVRPVVRRHDGARDDSFHVARMAVVQSQIVRPNAGCRAKRSVNSARYTQ